MTARTQRIAALLSVAWCASVLAAGDDGVVLRLEPRLSESAAAQTEGRPLYGQAEMLDGRVERELTLRGDAEVRRGGTVVRGDRITYYVPDDELIAVGNVRVVRQGNVFTGPQLQLKIDANEGFFTSPSYYLPAYKGHGQAERVDFLGPDQLAMIGATYSTCRPETPDWYLKAESLLLDQGADEGKGKSVGLYFKDRKILGSPLFGFPLSDERRSGFLAPTFAATSRTGPELVIPYYWNIAPNRDLTLYPRLMIRSGLQVGGLGRFLEKNAVGDVRFEFTPSDAITHTNRYMWSTLTNFTNVGGWNGRINARGVSDDNYFVDYSRSILSSSERVLPREIYAGRDFGAWSVLLRAARYQSILDARASPPYERVPQLMATHVRRDLSGFDTETLFDATWFRQPVVGAPEGVRLVAYPKVSYPIVRPGAFLVPRMGLHLSSYHLDSNGTNPTSLSRAVPVLSVDSGLVFERPAHFFDRDLTQTLEPRLFYVRTPYRDQSAFPVFDSSVADFNFAQLFSENTFLGNDRIADLNQLTTAVVSRLIDPASGAESMRMAFGQRLYFSEQHVTVPGTALRTDKRSDLLLAGSAALGGGMNLDAGLQYSVHDSKVPRLNVLWRYLPSDGRILNAGVRYLRDQLGQVDTSWRWPVAAHWMALGRVNYSWLKQSIDPVTLGVVESKPGIIEGVAGFEYSEDCWASRFVIQRFVTAAGKSTTAFFIQLELTGLGRIGSNPFDILRRNIPGYRLPTDRPETPSRFFGYE